MAPSPIRNVWLILLPAAVAAWPGYPATAQDAPAPAPTSQPTKGLLDPVYIDGSFAFSVQPPAGCTLYREKQVSDGDVEIARFINSPFQWSFSVRLCTTSRPLDAQTILDGLSAKLSTTAQELKVLTSKPARIANRDGALWAASFKADGGEWFRQQAVIPSQQTEYFTLVFVCPLADRQIAEPLFEKIVAGFQVLRDERTQAKIQTALERGTKLLQQAAAGDVDITANLSEESYLRLVMDGKEIGFVRVNERPTTMNHRKGVQINEWGWLFNPDGSTTHLEHNMFLATDLSFERWENLLYILTADQPNAPRKVLMDAENAIRETDQLGIAYLPKPNAKEKREKVISVEKSYAPAAMNMLFARMVDLAKPEVYAFSSYKTERRGMALRTLEVMGPSKVVVDGQETSAFRIDDSEGLIPPKSEMYVDRSGKLLRVVADRLEMIVTTAKYVDQRYAKQVKEAQDLFRKLIPQPPAANTPKLPTDRSPSPAQQPPTRRSDRNR